MKKYLPILILLLSLIACGKKESSIKKYYFPYASFSKPKVYQYVDRKDSASMMYWYFQTVIEKGDTLLTTCIFNAQLKPTIIYRNLITSEGSKLNEMLINMGDSTVMSRCQVKDQHVFNWKVKTGDTLTVSFKIGNAAGDESEGVITERSFATKKELVTFNGKDYECLVTHDFILITHEKTNRTINEEQQRTSYFADGIGLIAFETFNAQGGVTHFTLDKIIPEEEWNKMVASSPDSSDTATR